jgi:CheY-like chemotaxis protein
LNYLIMKILMASADHENRALAVLAFKELNAANALDFVATIDELMDYLEIRANSKDELPDLLLMGLDMNERDAIREVKAHSKLSNIKVVTFSIHSEHKNMHATNSEEKIFNTSSADELSWILKEICDGLVTKEGWRYSVGPSLKSASL